MLVISDGEKRYLRHSIENASMCIVDLFHNFKFQHHTKTNEFHIFLIFEIENVGQGHGGIQQTLRPSIANIWICIADFFFHNFSNPATYEIERIL